MDPEHLDLTEDELILDELGRTHFKLIKQITPEIFNNFLVAKLARSTCVSCDSGKLFVPHTILYSYDPDSGDYDDKNDVMYVTPQADSNKPFRIYTTRYEVCCQNCGLILQYQAYPIVKWAMKHSEVTGELL